jgi:hypothetical protein
MRRRFREERRQLAALAPDQANEESAGGKPQHVEIVRRGSRMIKRVRIDGCWYRTLDLKVALRAYIGPRGSDQMTLPPSTATSCLAFFLPIFGTSKSHTVPLVNCNRRDESTLPS